MNQPIDPQKFTTFEHAGWQKAVRGYHDYFSSLTNQAIEPLLDALEISKGIRLLDVATGPGYLAATAYKRGAMVTAVDFSKNMLKVAKKLHPNIDFQQGDAQDLPFSDRTFAAVAISFGMLHFAIPEKAIAEAYRVLTDGGKVGFTVWATPNEAVGFKVILDAIKKYGTLDVGLPAGPPFFRFSDFAESEQVLKEAGFTKIIIKKITMTWSVSNSNEFIAAFWKGTGRTGPLLRSQSDEALKKIKEEIKNNLKPYEKDGTLNIPMPAVLASAKRLFIKSYR